MYGCHHSTNATRAEVCQIYLGLDGSAFLTCEEPERLSFGCTFSPGHA